nr:DUF2971 domain-containing protein [Flavobacterium sp. NKUCC04_CG]
MDEDTVLYHYCSFSVFLSIIENKSFWLTNPLESNDSEEIKYSVKRLSEIFIERCEFVENATEEEFSTYVSNEIQSCSLISGSDISVVEGKVDLFFDNISLEEKKLQLIQGIRETSRLVQQELKKAIEESKNPYVSCFSLAKDKLSQWRGYADDGQGLAIGITVKKLREWVDKTEGLSFQPIAYSLVDQRNILNTNLVEFFVDSSKIKQWTHKILPTFKPEGFKEEEEWRLIYFSEGNTKLRFNYHKRGNQLGWHFVLPFDFDMISSIVIGPKSKIQPVEIALAMTKNGLQILESQIEISKLTYR